jgi:hypothetical protein
MMGEYIMNRVVYPIVGRVIAAAVGLGLIAGIAIALSNPGWMR